MKSGRAPVARFLTMTNVTAIAAAIQNNMAGFLYSVANVCIDDASLSELAVASQLRDRTVMTPVFRDLIEVVSRGIRVMRERDGVLLEESQIEERSRNIVAALTALYEVREAEPVLGPNETLARSSPWQSVKKAGLHDPLR